MTEIQKDVVRPVLARLLVATGAMGLLAAFTLSVDKVTLLIDQAEDRTSHFICDISAWVSCSSVIASPQSEVFGFPNSFIGIVGFTVVLTLGVVASTGLPFPNWIWLGLQGGSTFGVGFVTWLQFQSIHVLDRLCPYCILVWAVTIPLFVAVTTESLRRFTRWTRLTVFVSNWSLLIVALWYVAVAAAIWFQFETRLFA